MSSRDDGSALYGRRAECDLLDFVLQLGRDDMLAARATQPAHR